MFGSLCRTFDPSRAWIGGVSFPGFSNTRPVWFDTGFEIASSAQVGTPPKERTFYGAGAIKDIRNSCRVFTASFACSGEISISWWESASAVRVFGRGGFLISTAGFQSSRNAARSAFAAILSWLLKATDR